MRINLSKTLIAWNGKTITESKDEDSPPVTLGSVLTQACLAADPRIYNTGEEKYALWKLVQKLQAGGIVELTAEEITKLKKVVGESFTVAVVGPVWDALERPAEPEPATQAEAHG